jgi:hypothetical protein
VLMISTLIAASCAPSTQLVTAPVRLPSPPEALLYACDRPQILPDRSLKTSEVSTLWAQDRAALVMCRSRHQILVAHIRQMGQLLNNGP